MMTVANAGRRVVKTGPEGALEGAQILKTAAGGNITNRKAGAGTQQSVCAIQPPAANQASNAFFAPFERAVESGAGAAQRSS